MSELLPISKIRRDGGTQSRVEIDEATVAEYAARMQDGEQFPPLAVFYDGIVNWLADGFHRIAAAERIGRTEVECDVQFGLLADAQWYSFGANKDYDRSGKPRTNEDKRRAVEAALSHPKASTMSNRQVAEYVGVSEFMVRKHRASEPSAIESQSPQRIGKDGRVYDLSNLSKPKSKPETETEKTVEIVDRGTGEVLDDAEIVTTSTKRERLADIASETILIALDQIGETLDSIKDLRPDAESWDQVHSAAVRVRDRMQRFIADLSR